MTCAPVSNINFELSVGGTISGAVTAYGGVGIPGAHVIITGLQSRLTFQDVTGAGGTYMVEGLAPDMYVVKVEADGFQDLWWDQAVHRTVATPVPVTLGGLEMLDFQLEPGQSPAFIEVTSDPAGAFVYFDFQRVGDVVTPSVLDIGETVPMPPPAGMAPHSVWVKWPGFPWPAPRAVYGVEGETCTVHFDLWDTGVGALSVASTPAGVECYVDGAEFPAGLTPLLLSDLLPGDHTVLLKQDGYLLPRPVTATLSVGELVEVNVPLQDEATAPTSQVEITTVPPSADVYLDYLAPAMRSDFVTTRLDPAAHAGTAWQSTEHLVLARNDGYRAAAPRYVNVSSNGFETVTVVMVSNVLETTDWDEDGLPDQWEWSYDLWNLAPGEHGPDDDPDGDHMTNREEMEAGTNPLDPASLLVAEGGTSVAPDGETFQFVFQSVPQMRYLVQYSDDLGDWTTLSGIVVATAYQTVYEAVIPPGVSARAYRVIVLGF